MRVITRLVVFEDDAGLQPNRSVAVAAAEMSVTLCGMPLPVDKRGFGSMTGQRRP